MTFFGNAQLTHVSRLSNCGLRFVVGWLTLFTVYSKDVGKFISLGRFWYKGQIEPFYPKFCLLETLQADTSINTKTGVQIFFIIVFFFKYCHQKVCQKV